MFTFTGTRGLGPNVMAVGWLLSILVVNMPILFAVTGTLFCDFICTLNRPPVQFYIVVYIDTNKLWGKCAFCSFPVCAPLSSVVLHCDIEQLNGDKFCRNETLAHLIISWKLNYYYHDTCAHCAYIEIFTSLQLFSSRADHGWVSPTAPHLPPHHLYP